MPDETPKPFWSNQTFQNAVIGLLVALTSLLTWYTSSRNSSKLNTIETKQADTAVVASETAVDSKRLVADRTGKPEDRQAVAEAEAKLEEVKAEVQQSK